MASVESEHPLVEVGLEVLRADRALHGPQQPALDQCEDSVDRWQHLVRLQARCSHRGAGMPVVVPGRARISRPTVGDHLRAWFDIGLQERGQALRARVGYQAEPDSSETGAVALDGASEQHLAQRAAPSLLAPGRRGRTHRPLPGHVSGLAPAGPSPSDSDATSPTRSDKNPAASLAAPALQIRRSCRPPCATRSRTRPSTAYASCQRSCPPSPTPSADNRHTSSGDPTDAKPWNSRSEDIRIRRAIATNPSSPDTSSPDRTTPASPRTKPGNHAQHHARNSLNQGTKMESPLFKNGALHLMAAD